MAFNGDDQRISLQSKEAFETSSWFYDLKGSTLQKMTNMSQIS